MAPMAEQSASDEPTMLVEDTERASLEAGGPA
jgi:hypothetical protein